jgi:hypothetical protein
MLGHLSAQSRRDVLVEELPHFGDPRALGVVELEVHAGDTIDNLSTRRPNLAPRAPGISAGNMTFRGCRDG